MKILVIRFSSIGDVIWISPVIRCLKLQLKAEVHVCTKAAYSEMFEANPYIDVLHLLDKNEGLRAFTNRLQKEKYDYIIDLHKNVRSLYIKMRLWQSKSFTYQKLILQKWLYVQWRINKLPTLHVADRYLATLKPLGVQDDGLGLEYYIPERFELSEGFFPESHQKPYVALVIGASYYTKKLPIEKLLELCEAITMPIVLVGGKEDTTIANKILKAFQGSEKVWSVAGQLSISQSAWVLKHAAIVIGHDTGLTHVAACFHKRIYAIFGGTTPELGLYPYRTPHTIIENEGLKCRPCSRLGRHECPLGHFKCMREISFQKLTKDTELLSNS